MGRQICKSLHGFGVDPGCGVESSTGSGKEDRSWKVGRASLQTSPSVREGILGHHFGSPRNGVGVRRGGGVVDAMAKRGKAARSNLEKSGSGSSGGMDGK
jgi:hypothetical protein